MAKHTGTLRRLAIRSGLGLLRIVLPFLLIAGGLHSINADAARLRANVNLFTPEEDDIERDVRLNDVEDPDARAFIRATEVPSSIIRDELSFNPEDAPLGLGDVIINDEVNLLAGEWVASGLSSARFNRLAVASLFSGSRDADGFGLGGEVDSDARAVDTLLIGGSGEGELTFTFFVTGRVDASVILAPGVDISRPLVSRANYSIFFSGELNVRGGSADSESISRRRSTSAEGTTAFEVVSEEISISVPVQGGDTVDYATRAIALIRFSSFDDIAQRRGFSNFGSTATLTSVTLNNDNLSLSSESGFDYLAASENTAPDDGDTGGASNSDGAGAEPIPSISDFALVALASLLAALAALGVRSGTRSRT